MLSRRMDELGRIVLPMEVRKAVGFVERDQFDIIAADGRIIIQRHMPGCIICRSEEDVKKYKDKDICGLCYSKLTAS